MVCSQKLTRDLRSGYLSQVQDVDFSAKVVGFRMTCGLMSVNLVRIVQVGGWFETFGTDLCILGMI